MYFKSPGLIMFLFFSFTAYCQPGFGEPEKINWNWEFTLHSTDLIGNPLSRDTVWNRVHLPHDWSIKQKLNRANASCMGYLPGGIGWYRKTFSIPADKKDKQIYIYFEGVYNRSEVIINGKSVGKRPNGYLSFLYDLTPFIQLNKENTILVKVDHQQAADSRWYTGSGIYRDVWLIYANPVHIDTWGVYAFPTFENNKGILNIEVTAKNNTQKNQDITIKNELVDHQGIIVAKSDGELKLKADSKNKFQTKLVVTNPKLWNLFDPLLYELKTTIFQNGEPIDFNRIKTGFRSFTFNPNEGFSLNGNPTKVKGVCLHHDAGVLGAAMYKEVWRKRLQRLKEIGCNAIRTSHNPQATALYDLCDEMGFLVLNEAFDEWEYPKRKWLEGWNVGKPGYQGSYDFFLEWGARDLADMVRRDRNHISIFAWSIGNEVDYPNDPYSHPVLNGSLENGFTQKIFGGYKPDAPNANRLGAIAKDLVAIVKEYDRSRPVTAGLAGVAMSNETEYPSSLDIAGYNYTESRYESDHLKYPNRVIYGSENRHDLKAWKAVLENDHIFGQFLWTGIDYLGESGKWPSRGFYSGLLDFAGSIKPRGYFRQSLWSEKPMVYLGTYSIDKGSKNTPEDVLSQTEKSNQPKKLSEDAWPEWNYRTGEQIRVVCYTNTAKSQLLLNGKKVGTPKFYDPQTGIIYWDIPFAPGKLEVIGLNTEGKQLASYAIRTSQKAHSIKLTEYDRNINKNGGVAQVNIHLVDVNGVPVTDSVSEILCHVTGPGELLGLESANNMDMGDYTDNKQETYKGKLTAYIRSRNSKGEIKIVFSSKGLKPLHVTIN